jgi:hypothetical protein
LLGAVGQICEQKTNAVDAFDVHDWCGAASRLSCAAKVHSRDVVDEKQDRNCRMQPEASGLPEACLPGFGAFCKKAVSAAKRQCRLLKKHLVGKAHIGMLTVALAVKLIAEIALLSFIGQFVLGLLAGANRERNLVYQFFQVLTKPFTRLMRAITPKAVIDRHVPLAACMALLSVWVLATIAKIDLCVQAGMPATCK